jgi:uncharacterized repeat protein (TIGR03803 family)
LAGLIVSGNTLYGTASIGGTNGLGTVFAVNTDGTGFNILRTFSSAGNLASGLIVSGNTLYGTARGGGAAPNGAAFAINTDGTSFTNLYYFGGSPDGEYGEWPNAGLILSGNTLYGTTYTGGLSYSGGGTVFAVKTNGMGITTLHSFTGGAPNTATNSDGENTSCGLTLSGNTLYGMATYGGIAGNGTVFSLSLPLPPQLDMVRSGTNLILKWPTNATGFTLQSTTNLAPAAVWTTVTPAPVIVKTNNAMTNTLSGPQKFYRLSQ